MDKITITDFFNSPSKIGLHCNSEKEVERILPYFLEHFNEHGNPRSIYILKNIKKEISDLIESNNLTDLVLFNKYNVFDNVEFIGKNVKVYNFKDIILSKGGIYD